MPQEFAHLLPAERVLWARFLRRPEAAGYRFQYDLRLGQGRPPTPGVSAAAQADWILLSKQRVDVVGWRGTHPVYPGADATIFEIAPDFRFTHYGRLDGYERLFREAYPDLPPPHLVLVAVRIHPEILRLARARGWDAVLLEPEPAE